MEAVEAVDGILWPTRAEDPGRFLAGPYQRRPCVGLHGLSASEELVGTKIDVVVPDEGVPGWLDGERPEESRLLEQPERFPREERAGFVVSRLPPFELDAEDESGQGVCGDDSRPLLGGLTSGEGTFGIPASAT